MNPIKNSGISFFFIMTLGSNLILIAQHFLIDVPFYGLQVSGNFKNSGGQDTEDGKLAVVIDKMIVSYTRLNNPVTIAVNNKTVYC